MNRNDVIDVLTAVAAADRRTVGDSDVDVWQAIIGELSKDFALQAVRDHLRDRPGVWIEPGHVYQRARALRRDELEREPDSAREARQEALAAKASEDATELAERKGIPAADAPRFTRKSITDINPLTVKCPWCNAGFGTRCTIPGTQIQLEEHPPTRTGFHPSRIEAAEKAKANA